MLIRCLFLFLWIGILGIAAGLRIHNLDQPILHADEATGARFVSNRLSPEGYQFNPNHFHGPLLSALSAAVAERRGATNWRDLDILSLRMVTAISGCLLVLTPLLWLRWIGYLGALVAASLLATSPLLVYYSRTYIHESLLALLLLTVLPLALRFVIRPSVSLGLITGLFLGLVWATKETFVITLFAWVVAGMGILGFQWHNQTARPIKNSTFSVGSSLAALLLATVSTAFLAYSLGGGNSRTFLQAIETFWQYETVAGHDKPAYYYAWLLLYPKWEAAQLWWEGSIFLLIFLPLCFLSRSPKNSRLSRDYPVGAFLILATLTQFVVYSLIAYKTPWLMVVPWAHACILVAYLFANIESQRTFSKVVSLGAVAALLAFQFNQSLKATGKFSQDSRNPYAYAATSRNLFDTQLWLTALCEKTSLSPKDPLAVVGKQYWPLPWYLRGFDRVGYWDSIREIPTDMPVIFVLPPQLEEAERIFQNSHQSFPKGLRNDFPMIMFLRNDLWTEWISVKENPAGDSDDEG